MVGTLHLVVRDSDGNLQDIFVPACLKSKDCLVTTGNGVMVSSEFTRLIFDTTSRVDPDRVLKAVDEGIKLASNPLDLDMDM